MPLVSIVIPSFNCSAHIDTTIGSVLAQQGVESAELIVVDDGSTDDTLARVRAYGAQVRLLQQPNAGVSAARNRGIRAAQGAFIALLDHDDYWFPHKLAHQLAAFAAQPEVDVVFTDFRRWHADAPDGGYRAPEVFAEGARPQGSDPALGGWIYHRMLLDSWVLTSTALSRSSVFGRVGLFDESLPYSEDWDFWLRASRQCRFLKLREASTLYRQHAGQGSRRVRTIDYRTLLLEKAVRQWGLAGPDGRALDAAAFRRQLARYSAEFGLGHLSGAPGASRRLAVAAFCKSWRIDRRYWRSLGYLVAMALGWRPTYSS